MQFVVNPAFMFTLALCYIVHNYHEERGRKVNDANINFHYQLTPAALEQVKTEIEFKALMPSNQIVPATGDQISFSELGIDGVFQVTGRRFEYQSRTEMDVYFLLDVVPS